MPFFGERPYISTSSFSEMLCFPSGGSDNKADTRICSPSILSAVCGYFLDFKIASELVCLSALSYQLDDEGEVGSVYCKLSLCWGVCGCMQGGVTPIAPIVSQPYSSLIVGFNWVLTGFGGFGFEFGWGGGVYPGPQLRLSPFLPILCFVATSPL